MKFFQVFTMIVMVLATVGVIGESGRGKHVYIALFAAAGLSLIHVSEPTRPY